MQKISVKIDGIACGMCESHVNEAVRKAEPSNRTGQMNERKIS